MCRGFFWRHRVASTYSPSLFSNDVEEGTFLFEVLGKAVFCPKPWKPGVRDDVIVFDAVKHNDEFSTLKIDKSSAGEVLPILTEVLRTYWY